jgi:hypothetical protein
MHWPIESASECQAHLRLKVHENNFRPNKSKFGKLGGLLAAIPPYSRGGAGLRRFLDFGEAII